MEKYVPTRVREGKFGEQGSRQSRRLIPYRAKGRRGTSNATRSRRKCSKRGANGRGRVGSQQIEKRTVQKPALGDSWGRMERGKSLWRKKKHMTDLNESGPRPARAEEWGELNLHWSETENACG